LSIGYDVPLCFTTNAILEMGLPEIEACLIHLGMQEKVAASTVGAAA
jgi:hypothetical protein